MRELGFSPRARVLSTELISSADSEIADHLKLNEDAEIVSIERLFLENDHPLAIIRSMLPHRLCPGIIKTGLLNDSLTTTLEKSFGLYPTKIDQKMRAVTVCAKDADLLKIAAASAVFEITTTSQLEDGTVMEFARTLCVGDRIALHVYSSSDADHYLTSFEYVAAAARPDKHSS
jgi:GntR family transcriptional regulator